MASWRGGRRRSKSRHRLDIERRIGWEKTDGEYEGELTVIVIRNPPLGHVHGLRLAQKSYAESREVEQTAEGDRETDCEC